MERIEQQANQPPIDETACCSLAREAVDGEPGLVGVELDPARGLIAFDYNPRQLAEPDIVRIARRVAPGLQEQFDTCVLRVEPEGGRLCESCALALERRMANVDGVQRATVSYRSGVLSVAYDNKLLTPDEIVARAEELGARLHTEPDAERAAAGWPGRARAWLTADRLELIFTVIAFVAMMAGLLVSKFAAAPALSTALYGVAYVTGGAFGLKAGIESLRELTIDVDLLMILAAVGAWIVGAPFEGAMLLFLFSLSNVLQAFAFDRTRSAIRSLMKLRPKEALVRRGSSTAVVPVEHLLPGDIVIVRPGEAIPADGVVVEGESMIDQAAITGESIPVLRQVGDKVMTGTINQSGGLDVRVERPAEESTIAKIIKLVEEAQSEKAQTQRFIDTFEQYYALAVIAFTGLAILIPTLVLGEGFNPAFYRAMTIMVAASPCALVISTPASILSAIGNGARRGMLFKGGVHLERAADIKVIAFDKTGTLTVGKPRVTDVVALSSAAHGWEGDEDDLLALAAAVEARSEHPLAQAIVRHAQERALAFEEAAAFQAEPGRGVRADVDGEEVCVGSVNYLACFDDVSIDDALPEVERLRNEGKTSIVVARSVDGGPAVAVGVIALADAIRPDVAAVIADLRSEGIERVVMLTGDNERVAEAIAREAGIDEYYAELMPEDKVGIVRELKERYGALAMVGDGVNDAPALAAADIGIAMGAAGTDVALETADIVLMADELANIPYVIALSRRTHRTLITNLGFALFMIALMIAAIFAVALPLPLAVVGHEGGTVLVSLNGLRLLAFNRS